MPSVPEKFIRSVPVGLSRMAGYALSGFATIHEMMLEGKHRQARLHTIRMMAAVEQFLLDESWGVASRLTGVEEPRGPIGPVKICPRSESSTSTLV